MMNSFANASRGELEMAWVQPGRVRWVELEPGGGEFGQLVVDALGDGEAEAGLGIEVEIEDLEGDGELVAFPLSLR